MIRRYSCYSKSGEFISEPDPAGGWVTYEDHLAYIEYMEAQIASRDALLEMCAEGEGDS